MYVWCFFFDRQNDRRVIKADSKKGKRPLSEPDVDIEPKRKLKGKQLVDIIGYYPETQ